MPQNSYEGMLEKWKVGLMIRRAVRMGFDGEDLEDVLQELAMLISSIRYDASKTTLSEESILAVFMDNFLKNYRRSKKRCSIREQDEAQERGRHQIDYQCELNIQQEAEFELFKVRLDSFQREVFELMREGKDAAHIAKKLDVRWHTAHSAMNQITSELRLLDLVIS